MDQKQENQGNLELELLHLELEYLQLKGDFFESQTLLWNQLIYKQELKEIEYRKEEQELLDKFKEREIEKQKLIEHLKKLKVKINPRSIKKINGFQNCPECPFKSKIHLKEHINAVHRKLKPFQCLDCDKGLLNIMIKKSHYN